MSTTDSSSITPSSVPAGGDIVARPGTYYRRARYLMSLFLILGGGYFLYDGYIGYPKHNERVAELERSKAEAESRGDEDQITKLRVELAKLDKPHDALGILWQKRLGFGLPPVGLALLAWTLYRSRGVYRLIGETLHVPGHPPIAISEVTEIDNTLWERKGIAQIKYATTDGKSGEFKLDDFVYERKPIDAIYDRIMAFHQPAAATPYESMKSDNA